MYLIELLRLVCRLFRKLMCVIENVKCIDEDGNLQQT